MEQTISYKIRLISIHCYLTDEGDADEIYVKMNSKKIWPPSKFIKMKESYEPVNLEFKVEKGSANTVEVWDYDYLSSNDLLGTVEIVAEHAGGPYTVEVRKHAGTHSKYGLTYEIL